MLYLFFSPWVGVACIQQSVYPLTNHLAHLGWCGGRVGMGGVMTDAIACELRVAVAMAVAVSLVCALEERLV